MNKTFKTLLTIATASMLLAACDQKEAKTEQVAKKASTIEEIQKEKGNTLSYEEIGEFGPDHDKTFKFVVKLNDKVVGKGEGRTKKDAEQAAAGDALTNMKI